jgi:hypothetical protein
VAPLRPQADNPNVLSFDLKGRRAGSRGTRSASSRILRQQSAAGCARGNHTNYPLLSRWRRGHSHALTTQDLHHLRSGQAVRRRRQCPFDGEYS